MSSHNPYEGWNQNAANQRSDAGAGRQQSGPYSHAGANRSGSTGNSMSSQDFERMCQSIGQSVAQVAKIVGKGVGEAGSAFGQAAGSAYQQTYAAAGPKALERQRQAMLKERFRSTTGLTVSGVVLTVLGGTLTCAFVFALLVGLFAGLDLAVKAAAVVIFLGFTGLSVWALAAGIRRLQIAHRLPSFKRVFGNREVCNISELASQLRMSEAKVRSSARKMLSYRLLPQGHLDDEGACLMVTDNAYQCYLHARNVRQQQLRESQEQERLRAAQEAQASASEPMPAEAKAFLDQGNDFLRQLRELDVDIADVEVSAKIVAIEDVVGRILDRVREEPSAADDMGRLMSYYLPTTVKLLTAYDSLEEQPVQGTTITSSRKEIEQTLDVLRAAFEKMLDDSFQDLSLDVSSDISVLNAMLTQEGLTESPFDQKR